MIITITGLPGAGKSTIATKLSHKLGWPWFSMGDMRGKMARERDMTIDEFNALGEKHAFTDEEVDAYQTDLGKKQDHIILDGRLSWHFIPHSLKVFLDVDADVAAKRIFEAAKTGLRPDEKPYHSADEVKQAVAQRLVSDQKRYKQYYQVDYLDRSNYDLVIDTTDKNPDEIVKIILEKLATSFTNDVA